MNSEYLEILRKAKSIRQRKEEMERAIGRAVRNSYRDFETYVAIVSELRKVADRKGISIDEAADQLLAKQHGSDDEGGRQHDSDD